MSHPDTPAAAAVPESPSLRARRRRVPSPEEQARRVAWGRKWGPLVGASIRAAMKAAG